jgi:hypothetical protein
MRNTKRMIRQTELSHFGPQVDSAGVEANVEVNVTHYYPYCGGAYPDESDLKQLLNFYPILLSCFIVLIPMKR